MDVLSPILRALFFIRLYICSYEQLKIKYRMMMKKTILLLATITFLCGNSYAQNHNQSVKDSITFFYDSLFYHLETRFLYTKKVNWKVVKPFIKKKALKSKSFEASLETCVALFDTIKGDHLNLFSKKEWYKSTLGRALSQSDFHISLLEKHVTNPPFEVKLLDDNYGYVMIPGMLLLDISQDSLDRKTQEMYDQIMAIHQANKIKGWIIDLRLNGGGNTYPMLAALYHFIGDNTVYLMRDAEDNLFTLHALKKGAFYEEGVSKTFAKTNQEPDLDLPIALIIGKMSASAGELIPVSFRGRKNVITIGEESYGLLTGNDLVRLPFGTSITLTTGYLVDRKGNYTKTIIPDIIIEKQANFEDLTKDQNIIEAIRFIDEKGE